MPFFHGSSKERRVGEVVIAHTRPTEFSDRTVRGLLPPNVEAFVDKRRPRQIQCTRLSCLFMVRYPQCINMAGGNDYYSYEVRPLGKVSGPHHFGWFSEVLGLSSERMTPERKVMLAKRYAHNYWTGRPYPERHAAWEWLTSSFKIVRRWKRVGGVWEPI